MRSFRLPFIAAMILCIAGVASAQTSPPLRLVTTISLPDLKEGDFDHFVVDLAGRGDEGLLLARGGEYDLIILDVMLPGQDGWSVLAELRQSGKQTPVVLLTARDAEEDCCDAWVVWALPASARAYALALVETVDFLADARPALPALASGFGHVTRACASSAPIRRRSASSNTAKTSASRSSTSTVPT